MEGRKVPLFLGSAAFSSCLGLVSCLLLGVGNLDPGGTGQSVGKTSVFSIPVGTDARAGRLVRSRLVTKYCRVVVARQA